MDFNKNIFLDENKDLTQSIFKIKPGLVFTSLAQQFIES